MAKKKTGATAGAKSTSKKVEEPKKVVTDEQIENAREDLAKADEPKNKKKTPSVLQMSIEEFVVGTEKYRELVSLHNETFGTMYNPWRVRPMELYEIYKTLRRHFLKGDEQ